MHKIAIPDSIIAQVKAQRGRLNRYDRLIGEKTALVVIDLQNVFMLPGMPVEVFIATSERTLLSYLVKPLADQVHRAFREK